VYLPHIVGLRETIPQVIGGVLADEQYKLLKEFLKTHNENRVGYAYAQKVVAQHESEKKNAPQK
jgi:hypothetical protein